MASFGQTLLQFNVTVTRFDGKYPSEAPDSFVVGFTVTSKINGRSSYSDVRIPYADVKDLTDNQVIDSAWTRLEGNFRPWCESTSSQGSIVGSTYVPPAAQAVQNEQSSA